MTNLQFAHMMDADAFLSLTSDPINFSLAGGNVVVSGAVGQKVYVYRIFMVVSGDTTITFQDGPVTALSGPISLLANGAVTLDISNCPWFQTSEGNDFVINSSNAVQVGGKIDYQKK